MSRTKAAASAALLLSGALVATAPMADAEPTEFECLVEARSEVDLAAGRIGVVGEVFVSRGDVVQAGDVVARLRNEEARVRLQLAEARAASTAELRSSEARVDFESRRLERIEGLHEREIASERDLDEANSSLLIARANLLQARDNRRLAQLEVEAAQVALELADVVAPVSGVVRDVILKPGEQADPPQVVRIAEIDPLWVETYLPVSSIGLGGLGTQATVIAEAPFSTPRVAEVIAVDRVVDAASGTFRVRLELPNPGGKIPAGLRCRVAFPALPPEGERESGEPEPG